MTFISAHNALTPYLKYSDIEYMI